MSLIETFKFSTIRRDGTMTEAADLELAIKTSPDAYTFNPNDWFPIPRPTLPPHSQTPPRRESDAKKDSRPTSEESKEPAGKVAPGKVPNEKDTVKK